MSPDSPPLLALEPVVYLRAAVAASGGLEDFGDESFREPFTLLLDAVRREGGLTPQGQMGFQMRTLQMLTQRLWLEDLVRKNPQILREPIEKPVMILGLQRTGSTKLQRVMGADPYWNAPLLWEALFPVPLPGEKPGDPRPRIDAAKQWSKALYDAIPEALAGHAMFAEEVEEETFALEMSFRWTVASVFAYVQSYVRWIESHSVVPTYRYLKRLLQVLQWQRGTQRPWLLKAPWHLGFLDAILEVFPDVTIVQTNRDPAESVASSAALMYQGRSVGNPGADKRALGAEVLDMLGRQMRTHLRQRAALARDPTIDVDYRTVVTDPIGVARRIHAARGSALSAEGERRMLAWESENAQHKYGKFVYSAEEFGLEPGRIRAAFAEYCAKFGYP